MLSVMRVSCVLTLVGLCLVFLPAWTIAGEGGTATAGVSDCCDVDGPGDAPPSGFVERRTLAATSSTSTSTTTKTFRTDSGPELDWYQPCSGGDRLINFYIHVQDVELSSIEAARLTLAVWDVDYNCGSACGGVCERDTVYLNGHRLTTPVAYLTGANEQWSSVSFDVDPDWILDGPNYVEIYIDTLSNRCWCVTCDWGELQLEISELEVKVVEISSLDDTSITDASGNDIPDPIWKHDVPAWPRPIADSMRNSWFFFTTAGQFTIKTKLDGFPDKPPWKPKCEYTWWIVGSSEYDTGYFNDWEGQFSVSVPQKVGKYQLTLCYKIFDNEGNEINFQSMGHTLYVTYKQSLLAKPKSIWLDRACRWASGASDETQTVTTLNGGIYANELKWVYTYPTAPSWKHLVEGSGTTGDCVKFAEVWHNLSRCLGVASSLPSFERGAYNRGFVTITPARALDGNTGNGYPQGTSASSTDRWVFAGHQVGRYGGWFSSKYYDPTVGNVYNISNGFIQWDFTGTSGSDSNGSYRRAQKGNQYVKVYYRVGSPPWGAFEYFGPYATTTSTSSQSLSVSGTAGTLVGGAAFTGVHTETAIDGNADGSYEALSIGIELDVAVGGEYGIYGALEFAGDEITSRPSATSERITYAYLAAAPGTVLVQLTFSGEDIRRGGTIGSFTINVILIDRSGACIDTASFSTGSMNHADFGELPVRLESATDRGLDEDSDGSFEHLLASISVEATLPTDVNLEGKLLTGDGQLITSATAATTVVHTTDVELLFDGTSIAESQEDGPYILHVAIEDGDHGLIESQTYTTSPYNYAQFDSPAAEFTADFSDYGLDEDGDGSFDVLVVEAGIDTETAGSYTVRGHIFDSGGSAIAPAHTPVVLNPGLERVALRFDGLRIARSGEDGPYTVVECAIYNEHGKVIDIQADPYATAAYASSAFESPTAALSGDLSDYGSDTNGDGLFEFLVLEVGVDVDAEARYSLVAGLLDSNGVERAVARHTVNLTVGYHGVPLAFDGLTLNRQRVDGPYILERLVLTGEENSILGSTRVAYSTAAYSYQDFQRPPVELTGHYNDYGVDVNGDGIFDHLAIEVEAIVLNAGHYALNGRLMDKSGNEILWAANSQWLQADVPEVLLLNFDGPTITAHGETGPFFLRDVYLYNQHDPGQSDYVYDAHVTMAYNWPYQNRPPTADAGPDQTVECACNTPQGTQIALCGNNSNDPDGDPLTFTWLGPFEGSPLVTSDEGSTVKLLRGCVGEYEITLIVNDGEVDSDPDTVLVTVEDTTPPEVQVTLPQAHVAIQDGVTFTAEATDACELSQVFFCLREPGGAEGVPIGYEDLPASLNAGTENWECPFDSTHVQDGYYVILAKAADNYGNEGQSEIVPFSIRNWAVLKLLPASQEYRAGRTIPVKFSLRIAEIVDPAQPFVYNEELEIRVYDSLDPATILQASQYGDTARDYRIDTSSELYITNFKTPKRPAEYTVEIWRPSNNFMVGSFTFETQRK